MAGCHTPQCHAKRRGCRTGKLPEAANHLGNFPTLKNAEERVGIDGKSYPVLLPPPVRRSGPPDMAVMTAGACF